jgi:uncharacterized protein GlcG (DUF336 family)
MPALTMDNALAIIQHTFAHAKKLNAYAFGAIVLDAGGQVVAFLRQDGASIKRFEIARGKAFACLALNRSSRQVLQKAREKPLFMETLRAISDGPIFLEAGGQLIRDAKGEIVGAIGVTGDVNEVDDLCAMAGIRAAGFRCDSDFSDEECKRLNIKKDAEIRDPR